jgi:hypothetical protein
MRKSRYMSDFEHNAEEFDGYKDPIADLAGRVYLPPELLDLFRFEIQSIGPENYALFAQLERDLGPRILQLYGRYLDPRQVEYFLTNHINLLNIDDSIVVSEEYPSNTKKDEDYYKRVAIEGRVFATYETLEAPIPLDQRVGEWNLHKNHDAQTSSKAVQGILRRAAGFMERVGRIPVLINRWSDNIFPSIDYLRFEGSPSINIASTITHEKLHGCLKSVVPLPIEEILVRYYIRELFKSNEWVTPNFGVWEEAIGFLSEIINHNPNQEELHLFFFGNLNDPQREEEILSYLKNIFNLEQLQKLLSRIKWYTYDL